MIIQIGIEADESRILWKHSKSDEWQRADIDDLIDAYESRPAGWIPVIWHEITDEERNREGYPKDWVVHIDCEMPSDEQEILVTTRWGTVEADVCYEDGEFSLDSGYDWIDDIIAWMPRPNPYKCGAKMGGGIDD